MANKLVRTQASASPFFIFPAMILLQMGFSYYISVQAALFVYLLSKIPISLYARSVLPVGLLLLLMMPPAFFYDAPDQANSVLNSFRQFVCLSVLVTILMTKKFAVQVKAQQSWVLFSLSILGFLVLLQAVALQAGMLLAPPATLLIANTGTLEQTHVAASFGLIESIRPAALYGEPSYLAFISLSLLTIAYSWPNARRNTFYGAVLCLAIVLLSQSLSAFLGYLVLTASYLVTRQRLYLKSVPWLVVGGLAAIAFFAFFDGGGWAVSRLAGILSSDMDSSAAGRLVAPFFLVGLVFQDYFFGVPSLLVNSYFGGFFENGEVIGTDNGLFNLFINFGYSGFVIISILIFLCRKNLLLMAYIFLSTMFNGAFLSVDKIAVIGFVILLSRAADRHHDAAHQRVIA